MAPPVWLWVVMVLGALSGIGYAKDAVIDLKVTSGGLEPERDSRVFGVHVRCNGTQAVFVWGCGGWTTVRAGFAKECGLAVEDDEETAEYVDAAGQKMFLGKARAAISFAGRAHNVVVKVARDADYNKDTPGVIGYDVASKFQWELNPDHEKPTLTVRDHFSDASAKPIAVLPLRDEGDNYWVGVTIRNSKVDVLLLPQSSDIQAAPDMQKAWDLGGGADAGVASEFGTLRTRKLPGKKDYVELSKDIQEGGVTIILVGDKLHPERTPNARSGLGASFLNRFTYCVDPGAKQFMIIKRSPPISRKKPPAPGDK